MKPLEWVFAAGRAAQAKILAGSQDVVVADAEITPCGDEAWVTVKIRVHKHEIVKYLPGAK